tara:strand:+ start:5149 stop:5907 length:759 start_codon:yes stop_codon:yes gene_type:complete
MGRLEQKIALITGGAKGQGEAEAKLFAAEGAKVILTDILDDEGKKVESEITELGGEAIYKHLDVSLEKEWESIGRFIEERYGRLDILLNNAGISVRNQGMDISVEDWDLMMEVNAKGVFLGTKSCVPIMQKSGGGSIINISSVAGIAGRPMASPAYSASKGAVRVFTKSTAGRFASDGIRANSIHPGPIDTDFIKAVTTSSATGDAFKNIPLGRLGQPEDIAYGALFLASDESSFITASELVIDGGVTGIRT